MKKQSLSRTLNPAILGCCLLLVIPACKDDREDDNILQAGVFGGSTASRPESETAKTVWKNYLQINVTTCGVEGAGFSSLTYKDIPTQIRQSKPFDIYIIWASTNDFMRSSVGQINVHDDTTQDGGILKSLRLIRQKNNKALVLFFTSLPRFDDELYPDKQTPFVDDQIAICERHEIPYLDQFRLCGFDLANHTRYYLPDKAHLNLSGYRHIAFMQMTFIRENILKHPPFSKKTFYYMDKNIEKTFNEYEYEKV
jgi:lysophospholipase L1-like esterase